MIVQNRIEGTRVTKMWALARGCYGTSVPAEEGRKAPSAHIVAEGNAFHGFRRSCV